MYFCKECNSKNVYKVKMYKRIWVVCSCCGSAYPNQRSLYPFNFIPGGAFKRKKTTNSEMYDYFTDDVHLEYSHQEVNNFRLKYINSNLLDIKNKKILDISGGNGVFLSELCKLGANGTLTEFNQKAVNFAKSSLGLNTIRYDLNSDDIGQLVEGKFDVILLRACIMFCNDLPKLLTSLKTLLNENGTIFVQYAVYPTIGTLVRTQLDEFSYARLRSPQIIRENFIKAGFREDYFEDEIDPTSYAYDHDKLNSWLFLHYIYEIFGILRIRKHSNWVMRSRTRNRANFIFRI